MSTNRCDDCVHVGLCTFYPSDSCLCYRSKSRSLYLPCNIGDKVYIIKGVKDGPSFVVEKIVSGIHITERVNRHRRSKPAHYLVVVSDVGFAQHIDMKHIGKTVFFDEYEAHKVIEGAN